jgi:hypothetical protein
MDRIKYLLLLPVAVLACLPDEALIFLFVSLPLLYYTFTHS